MATEILRPQDCLARRIGDASPAACPRRRSCSYGSSYSNPRPNRRHHQHPQRKPAVSKGSSPAVLRRGEPLGAAVKDSGPVVVSGLGPEPGLRSPAAAPGGRAVVYAGSAFAVSPEPSSLPLPTFWKNKKKQALLVDDSATRDLRRLLRLDLL